jgi:endonuclease III
MEDTIRRLADDFENERGPFSVDNFPEKRLVDELGDEHKLAYLSAFCTWDYNRGVDNLVENVVQVYEENKGVFNPAVCVRIDLPKLQDYFSEVGFRYPNRDAKGWQDNCQIIVNRFSAEWENLLGAAQFSAPTLVQLLRKEGFKYLKGDKLAPFYARVVNDHVAALDDLWQLDIPVDVHIRRLSRDLFQDDDMSDDDIRARWREIGQSLDLSPALVDGGLWQVGYSWDDWGEDYWEDING